MCLRLLCPFRAKNVVGYIDPQGVALSCHVAAFQAKEWANTSTHVFSFNQGLNEPLPQFTIVATQESGRPQ